MTLADVAELIGPETFEAERLGAPACALRLHEFATPEGLWLQVIDRTDLPGNYAEGSASAMLAYALLKLDRLGTAPGAGGAGAKALAGLTRRIEAAPVPVLPAVCHVAGFGGFGGRYRDGTQEYYLTEEVVEDDVKGVGPIFMALGEQILRDRRAIASPALRRVV